MSGPLVLKRCFYCQREKPIEEFARHPRAPGGYRDVCIPCMEQKVKQWGGDR